MTQVDLSLDTARHSHYVDWGSIIAGAFVAVAVSTIFLAFGSAIGLSMTSFQSTSAASATGLAVAGALWLLWVQVSSFAGGGYIAGRMRRHIGDGKPHEVEMRDGSRAYCLGCGRRAWHHPHRLACRRGVKQRSKNG